VILISKYFSMHVIKTAIEEKNLQKVRSTEYRTSVLRTILLDDNNRIYRAYRRKYFRYLNVALFLNERVRNIKKQEVPNQVRNKECAC